MTPHLYHVKRISPIRKAWNAWGDLLLGSAKVFMMFSLGVAFLTIAYSIQRIERTADEATELMAETRQRVIDTSQNLNALLIQVGLAADQARLASRDERQYLLSLNSQVTKLLKETTKTVKEAHTTIHTINDETASTMGQARETIAGISPILNEAEKTTKSMNKVVSDPNIPKSLAHIEKTTANLQESSEDIKRKVKEITRPVGWMKRVGLTVLKVAIGVRELVF